MHVCHGPVKIIYINVGQQSESLCLPRDIDHTESDIPGDASQTGLCPTPLLRDHHESKKG